VCEGVVGLWYPTRERCLCVESRVRVRVPLCAVGRLVVRWYIVAALSVAVCGVRCLGLVCLRSRLRREIDCRTDHECEPRLRGRARSRSLALSRPLQLTLGRRVRRFVLRVLIVIFSWRV
jgi:hypothetical protein